MAEIASSMETVSSESSSRVRVYGVVGLLKLLRVQVRGSFEEFLFWIFLNNFKLQGA